MKPILIAVITLLAVTANAMDRFEALSQIESGDCDNCIGPSGEVSRYQMLPRVWQAWSVPFMAATSRKDAARVAGQEMFERGIIFSRLHGRPPTDFEWYLLWHRPACVLGGRKLTAKESDLAHRFANLCAVKP